MRRHRIFAVCVVVVAAISTEACVQRFGRTVIHEKRQRTDAIRGRQLADRAVASRPLPARPEGKPVATAVRSFDRKGRPGYRRVPASGLHRVRKKETVYAISRLYGVPVRSLLRGNSLHPPYKLQLGQTIRVPAQRTHVVAKGQTVYAISRQYDVSLNELVRLNAIAAPYTIKTGETLLMPDPEPSAPSGGRRALSPPVDPKKLAVARPRVSRRQGAPAPRRVLLPPSIGIPRPGGLSRRGFLWPVSGHVLSGFGRKGKGLHNDGINIAAKRGAPVRAAQNGVVVYRGNELRGFGNLILIRHAKGYMTAYGHNSKLLVKRGQRVRRGQLIARVGSTGNVAKAQLHFEIRFRRRAVDPMRLLRSRRAARPPGIRAAHATVPTGAEQINPRNSWSNAGPAGRRDPGRIARRHGRTGRRG